MTKLVSLRPHAAMQRVDRQRAEVVAHLHRVGEVGHDLLGHALVGLVLEVQTPGIRDVEFPSSRAESVDT
jgi:hypothetical protein